MRTFILGRGGAGRGGAEGGGQGRCMAPGSQAPASSGLDAFGGTTTLERPNPRSYALGTELESAL